MRNALPKAILPDTLDISAVAILACLKGQVYITRRLWKAIAGDQTPFTPEDYRLQELCWGLYFAQAGVSLSTTRRLPGLKILCYRMVYDPPSTLKKVNAIFFADRQGQPVTMLDVADA